VSYLSNKILTLAKQLFPNGRAWWVPAAELGYTIITDEDGNVITTEAGEIVIGETVTTERGWFERFLQCFTGYGNGNKGTSEQFILDCKRILTSRLPNNSDFTDGTANPVDNDCNDWELALGLTAWGVTSSLTPTRLARMQIIATKMRYPGGVACRQTAEYLQAQLRSYGFDVYVYENLSNLTPSEVLGIPAGRAYYGSVDYGQADYGETYGTTGISIIANHINEIDDADFSPGPVNYGTFFISGATITTFATIPTIQKAQFRQIVLELKPGHMAAVCFINFT